MKRCFIVLAMLVLVFSVSFASIVSADFARGNWSIDKEYGGEEKLRGYINISLQDEEADSLFTCFDDSLKLVDFLESAGANYDCFPEDCETYYGEGSHDTTKNFSLSKAESKIIGLKFQGELKNQPIQGISFKVASSAGGSCFQPLKINILDDDKLDWYSTSGTQEFICSYSTGCFNSGEMLSEYNLGMTPYCQKISVPPNPEFEVGAYIINGSTANPEFKMQIYDEELYKIEECTLPKIDGSGEVSCRVSLNLAEIANVFVCIKADKATDYKIQGEDTEPCGFYGIDSVNFISDYNIFARGNKYSTIDDFTLDETEFAEYSEDTLKIILENYLYEKFDYNCTNGCIIPIKFTSGTDQEITLSELSLSYDTESGLRNENNFYDVVKGAARITSDFLILDLDYANFTVPKSDGEYNARIYLGGDLVAQQDIQVFAAANINGLNTQQIPAAVPSEIIAYVTGVNVTSYNWNFGDGTGEETTENKVIHTYSEVGQYTLKLEVTDNQGKKSVKSFEMTAINPKDYVEASLKVKRENLNETLKNLEAVTAWYKEELGKKAGLDGIDAELKSLEQKYDAASTSEEYALVMSELQELEVPYSLEISELSGDFFLNKDGIKPAYLTEITGEKVEDLEGYEDSIVGWFGENLEVKIEIKTVYLYYTNKKDVILSALTLKIKPKKDQKEFYLIIDRSYDEITFNPNRNNNEKALGSATALTFQELKESEEEIVEFILPEEIKITEVPAYISPDFSELPEPVIGEIPVCNNDGECEKEIGETSKNCPNDCPRRQWGKIILYLVILLFAAFVVYIILQEWYKRHYEDHLFKNKNDLYNLICFVHNALSQGLDKKQIIKKLKAYGWNSEQIIYAFKKAQGKRTGMWEIPIFRPFEKRKLEKELEKRRKSGMIKYNPIRTSNFRKQPFR